MAETGTRSGPAVYFDGITSARHLVTVICAPEGLVIKDRGGIPIAQWPYDRLAQHNAPGHVFRLGLRDDERLERLEIGDRVLAEAIDLACPDIDRTDERDRIERRRVLFWSCGAIVSLVLVALYGVPRIGDQLARMLPPQIEENLGRAADLQFRNTFDENPKGRPFECGGGADETDGKQVFDRLMARIAKAAGLDLPIHAVVVRRAEPNAFALAGGHVYVLKGLVENAKDVDEVAAVIAHELGHVANRDGTRSILQSAGLSLIFGMLLGDFVGGAAVVVAARYLFKAAYSRRQETAADDFAVRTLQELNANPRALAEFLERVAHHAPSRSIFLGHPSVPERVARINATAPVRQPGEALLDTSEWQALRRICSGYP